MEIELTKSEANQIIIWADRVISGGHFGDANFMVPEEEGTLRKIKAHDGGKIEFTPFDIRIIKYWAEGTLGSSLHGMVPEEISVIEKIFKN